MYHGLECVFQFLLESKTLENVNDTKEEQQALTLHISCRNASRTTKIKIVGVNKQLKGINKKTKTKGI